MSKQRNRKGQLSIYFVVMYLFILIGIFVIVYGILYFLLVRNIATVDKNIAYSISVKGKQSSLLNLLASSPENGMTYAEMFGSLSSSGASLTKIEYALNSVFQTQPYEVNLQSQYGSTTIAKGAFGSDATQESTTYVPGNAIIDRAMYYVCENDNDYRTGKITNMADCDGGDGIICYSQDPTKRISIGDPEEIKSKTACCDCSSLISQVLMDLGVYSKELYGNTRSIIDYPDRYGLYRVFDDTCTAVDCKERLPENGCTGNQCIKPGDILIMTEKSDGTGGRHAIIVGLTNGKKVVIESIESGNIDGPRRSSTFYMFDYEDYKTRKFYTFRVKGDIDYSTPSGIRQSFLDYSKMNIEIALPGAVPGNVKTNMEIKL